METFLEIVREILKGAAREISAYLVQKNLSKNKKTTPQRPKHKGGSRKTTK